MSQKTPRKKTMKPENFTTLSKLELEAMDREVLKLRKKSA